MIEVGITSFKNLKTREIEKKCKYFKLGTDIFNERVSTPLPFR